MTVRADSKQLDVDPASLADLIFVSQAFLSQPGSLAGREVNVFFRDVDVLEEVLAHEGPVALRVVRCEVAIFIEVECAYRGEIHTAFTVGEAQLLVDAERGGAGGESYDKIRLALEGAQDLFRRESPDGNRN